MGVYTYMGVDKNERLGGGACEYVCWLTVMPTNLAAVKIMH